MTAQRAFRWTAENEAEARMMYESYRFGFARSYPGNPKWVSWEEIPEEYRGAWRIAAGHLAKMRGET